MKKLLSNKLLISFILSCICIFVVISYNQQLGNSKYFFVIGDSLELYVPTIVQFVRDLIHGQSIYFSWNNSFGMNTSMINAFSSFNILNILFLFKDVIGLNKVVVLIVVIKFGLVGSCSYLFFNKALKLKEFTSMIFSIMYSLCSFQLDSNTINFMWIDAVYLLPAILFCINIEARKGRFIVLPLLYLYLFTTNFYMGYVVGFVSLAYFIYLIVVEETLNKNSRIKLITLYIISVLISILASAFVWLPALLNIINSYSPDSTSNVYLSYNLFEIFIQMFFGSMAGAKNSLPDIYSGVLCVLFTPLYFIIEKNVKKKIFSGAALLLLFASCLIPFLYLFWHAFDSPDGWLFRFAFVISFTFCVLAAEAFDKISSLGYKKIVFASVIETLLLVLCWLTKIFVFKVESSNFALISIAINISLVSLWNFLLFAYIKNNKNNLRILLILLVCLEMIANGIFCFYKDESKQFKEDFYKVWDSSEKKTLDKLAEDKNFYRVSYNSDIISNSDTLYGYNGDSDFGTSENYHVRNLLSKMGIYTSERVVRNFGNTKLSNMILGIKYIVNGVNPYTYEGENVYPEIELNDYYLSVGYLVDDSVENCVLESSNAFENNNELISSMVGENIEVFKIVNEDKVLVEDYGIKQDYNSENDCYILTDESEGDGSLMYVIEDREQDYYYYMDNFVSTIYGRSMLYSNGFENAYDDLGYTSVSYLKKFSNYNDISYVEIYSNALKSQVFKDYYVYYLDNDVLDYAFDKLKNDQLEVISYKDGYIKGSISTKNANQLMFTSIPYLKGWKIYVDGKEIEKIELLDGAFLGLRINNPGEHIIEFKYKPDGVLTSIIVSIIGLLSYLVLILFLNKFIKI